MKQSTALQMLQAGENIFLTGSAGTGKTYLLNSYIQYLRERNVNIAITASTGIAATHIGGQTIHSWAGIGIRDTLSEQNLHKLAKNAQLRRRIEKVQVLIIDEISMLSGQTLGLVDQVLRYFKVSFSAFGGIQVIFSGDFFQLPPISREPLTNAQKFAFMHPVWREANLKICYLTEQFRQDESSELTRILNQMRTGEIEEDIAESLLEKHQFSKETPIEHAIKLFTHNADVDRINIENLDALDGETRSFAAKTFGAKPLIEGLKKSVLAPEFLELKIGAPVMFVKNNYEAGYLNGTMGKVVDFNERGFPVIETLDGRNIFVRPVDWAIGDEVGEPAASLSQIPLRLAWAITIHKSQGMTLDSAEMDLSRTFEAGQAYVALSRVKSWEGLRLLGVNQNIFFMDELALRADKRFMELSDEVRREYEKISEKEHEKSAKEFVIKIGGYIDLEQIEQRKKELQNPKKIAKKSAKIPTHEETKLLVEQGKTLQEIAESRSLKLSTIISHLEKIREIFPECDLERFRPDKNLCESILLAVKNCRAKSTPEDLLREKVSHGLLFRELGGAISYDDIKLGLLFIDDS